MVHTTRFIIDRSVLHNGVTLKIPLMIQIPPISNPYFKLCGSGRRSVITVEVCRIVEKQMRRDDETTASQLYVHLTSLGYALNLRTILCCRTSLGWTFRGSAYRPQCMSTSYSRHCFLLSAVCTQMAIALCRIMIPSMHLSWRSPFCEPMASIGGRCRPSHQT